MKSPRPRAYAAATKAASVGVKTPESIPPKSRTGVSSDRVARRVRRAATRTPGEGWVGKPRRRANQATMTMRAPAMRKPGTMPPRKRRPMEASATTP